MLISMAASIASGLIYSDTQRFGPFSPQHSESPVFLIPLILWPVTSKAEKIDFHLL